MLRQVWERDTDMRFDMKSAPTALAILAGMLAPSVLPATQTTPEVTSRVLGLVEIEAVRMGALLQLRGLVGRGHAILRVGERDLCVMIPLRFAAGGFDGERIGISIGGPVRLALEDASLICQMATGEVVISDHFDVTGNPTRATDIRILSGFEESYGFVINPGLNIWAELFGPSCVAASCTPLDGLEDQTWEVER